MTDAGDGISRRKLMVGAACGASCLALPTPARAVPPLWIAFGKFIAATAVSWGITKVLDYFWEHPASAKAEPLKSHFHDDPKLEVTPSATTGNVQAWFAPVAPRWKPVDRPAFEGETLLHARHVDGSRHGIVPSQFVRALDDLRREEATLATAFTYWGPLDGEAIVGSPLDLERFGGGSLIGVWWGRTRKGGRRFVVIRNTSVGAVYIPCINDYAEDAFRVVSEGDLTRARGRLTTLIVSPRDHRFNLKQDAPDFS